MSGRLKLSECTVAGAFKLLDKRLVRVLCRYGYEKPTPVQERAIPLILKGYNVLITAPTGSGKTEAALFPVMSTLVKFSDVQGSIFAIYITPLRSLNRDIFVRMSSIAREIGLTLSVRHGDTSEAEKRRFLENPPHIVVMTPETFYFLLSIERFRSAIRSLKFLIIDEVHELISDKRGAELSLALERVLRFYTVTRPTIIALSATIAKPHEVMKRVFGGRFVIHVECEGGGRSYDIRVFVPNSVEEDVYAKAKKVLELARMHRSVLVFTNTRDTAEVLGALLRRIVEQERLDVRVEVHHGSLSREHRVRVEREFKSGNIDIVVATSSLEMGIDIGHVDFVIQYSSPRQAVKLVQRVGRASHRLGAVARGAIVASPNVFDILESAVLASRASRGNLEYNMPPEKPYDALIHQLTGLVIERPGMSLNDAYWLIVRSGFYSSLTFDEFLSIVSFMEYLGLVRVKEGRLYPGRRAKSYYYSVTMIPDTKQYPVYDVVSGSRIGVLDEEFVATIDVGDKFVLAGRVWVVEGFREQAVYVRESQAEQLIPPAWEGDLIPVDYKVAREVASIFRRFKFLGREVLCSYPLSEEACRYVSRRLSDYLSRFGILPDDSNVIIEYYGDTYVVYTFLGSRGNKALEYLLSEFISQSYGLSPLTASTPYVVVLRFPSNVPQAMLEDVLKTLARLPRDELVRMYNDAVKASRVYRWLLYHVAVRSGAIDLKKADLSRVKSVVARLVDTPLGVEALRDFERRKGDANVVLEFLSKISSGRARLVTLKPGSPSSLTLEAVGEARFTDRIAKLKLTAPLMAEIVKRRLAGKDVCLVCLHCGHMWERRLGELPQRISCPACGASMIYVSVASERCRQVSAIVRKKNRGVRLTREDANVLREAYDVASLINTYGRYAVEALASRGIGVSTARKVLQKLVFGEEQFYKALVEAEVLYLKYSSRIKHKNIGLKWR